jgi:hypothetical protein
MGMREWLMAVVVISALMTTGRVSAADENALDGTKVVSLTRFLEDRPLDKQAPSIRAALVQWEADSKDVMDVVCPGVFAPVPDSSIKYSSELLGQFIFGSAAHQLVVPADKGKLMPAQLAGMTSMLKAYRAFLAADKEARIPRFDALLRDEASGSLANTLEPLVIAHCLPRETGKSRFPWTFGMSQAQVSAVDGHGPYRSFSNGDLETYNAVFDGHFQNFQFFFHDNQLRRISVYTFEGTDLAAATQAWGSLYESMQRNFGDVETPANKAPSKGDADSMKAFEGSARTLVEQGGKAQMAPMHQPADVFSFASFSGREVQGTMFYYITLHFDPPHETRMTTAAASDK